MKSILDDLICSVCKSNFPFEDHCFCVNCGMILCEKCECPDCIEADKESTKAEQK